MIIISNFCSNAKEQPKWGADFYEYFVILRMGEQKELKLNLKNLNKSELIESSAEIRVVSDSYVLRVDKKIPVSAIANGQWHGVIAMEAVFLGAAQVFIEIESKTKNESQVERSMNYVYVDVIRKRPPVWMYTDYYDIYELVLYLVTRLLLGAVLKWHEVMAIFEKPLCVAVSFCCSILIMPMVSEIVNCRERKGNQIQIRFTFFLNKKDGLRSGCHHFPGRWSNAIRITGDRRMFDKRNFEFLDRVPQWEYRIISCHEHDECHASQR